MLLLDGSGMHYTALLQLWTAAGSPALPCGGPPTIMTTGYLCSMTGTESGSGSATTPEGREAMARIRACGANLLVGALVIIIRFLPPNTTALIQPCDQGFIAGLKRSWRTALNHRLVHVPAVEERDALLGVTVADMIAHAASRGEVDASASWNPLLSAGPVAQEPDPISDPIAELEELVAVVLKDEAGRE